MPSFAGARAKLATATQDLFRLSGHYSIPVEPPAPEPPPAPELALDSTSRKAESSIMFSLEALMKANAPASKREAPAEEVSEQLWNMQAATPLFGTAQDQALLTTPLKVEPSPSMDSMTLPSHSPSGRRWWPLAVAAAAGLALAAGGVWFFRTPQGAAPAAAAPASEQATLAAQPPAAQLPPVEEPAQAEAAAAVAPAAQPEAPVPGEAAPSEPSAEAAQAEPGSELAAPNAATAAAPAAAAPAAAAPASAAKSEPPRSTRKPPPRAVAPISQKAFDKNAAKAALATATSLAAGCGAGGAPGKGKIQVTFAPSGKVSDAALVEGPFAGTAAGKCALRHFRAARVPAFSGSAVTVAKSFKVD
jgi:hypothetical protein